MTVMLIRQMAKELAGIFYTEADSGRLWSDTKAEHARSQAFRDTYPTLDSYLKGYQRCQASFAPILDAEGNPPIGYFRVEFDDRWWKIDKPGWHYFVDQAKQTLATMLNNPTVSAHEKTVISDALIEENERALKAKERGGVEQLLQRRMAGKTQIN